MWVNNQTATWDEGEGYCWSKGGHLASIGDDEVQEHLSDVVGQQRVWIGLQKTNGSWEWSDRSQINFTGDIKSMMDDTRNCIGFSKADHPLEKWRNLDCDTSLSFVCARTIVQG